MAEWPTPDEINAVFQAAWEEFGDDKSTEFLLAITADRLEIDYDAVVSGLAAKWAPKDGEE